MELITQWAETIQLLKSLGFAVNDENLEYPVYDLDPVHYLPNDLILVEKEFSRNRLAIVLGEEDWTVHVQIDAGCGWVEIPVRWCDIEVDWLTHLKKAFDDEGFKS